MIINFKYSSYSSRCSYSSRYSNSSSGFTLVEMAITVSILSLITFLAAPSFSETVERYRTQDTKENFLASLRLAQSEAQKTGYNVYLCAGNGTNSTNTSTVANCPFDIGTGDWHISGRNDNFTVVRNFDNHYNKHIFVNDSNFSETVPVTFTPSGMPLEPITFSLCEPSKQAQYNITVTVAGAIIDETVSNSSCAPPA